jgi:hypothetical protein
MCVWPGVLRAHWLGAPNGKQRARRLRAGFAGRADISSAVYSRSPEKFSRGGRERSPAPSHPEFDDDVRLEGDYKVFERINGWSLLGLKGPAPSDRKADILRSAASCQEVMLKIVHVAF